MDVVSLKHRFESEAVDAADTTKLRPSDWGSIFTDYVANPTHVFSGGVEGSLLLYSVAAPDKVAWLAAPVAGQILVSNGIGAAPIWGGNALFVNPTTGEVGIGTTSPVSGSALTSGGNLAFRLVIAPGALTGGAPTAGGGVDDGAHLYKVTFVTAVGETELGTVSSVVTTGGGNNTIPLSAIPISSDPRVTGRKIYRTKAGTVTYFLVVTLANNSVTTCIDAASDASLGSDDWINRNNLTAGVITATDVATYPIGIASTNNTGWGKAVLNANRRGAHLAAFAVYSLLNNRDGDSNSGFGANTLRMNVDGNSNTAGGTAALYSNVDGSGNAAWGVSAGTFNLADGGTFLGTLTGFSTTTQGGGVFVGYGAGYHETAAMKLFIDNALRASEADGRAKALIYGIFNAATASQVLAFNAATIGMVYLPTYADEAAAAGLASGTLYRSATGELRIKL